MIGIFAAALCGAAIAYLFDPDRGRDRRESIGNRASTTAARVTRRQSKVDQVSEQTEIPAPANDGALGQPVA